MALKTQHWRARLTSAITATVAAALLVALSSCAAADYVSGSGSSSFSSQDAAVPGPENADGTGIEPGSAEIAELESAEGAKENLAAAGQAIIQTGEVSIEVADPATAAAEVVGIAKDLGGYVQSQTVSGASGSEQSQASVSMRVPSDSFDAAFLSLGEVGTVLTQNRSTDDVSLQRVDLQARVTALEQSIDRLQDLMSQAATTGELIEAESALSQRQQDLDGLQAQLDALDDQVSYSTIWVSLGSSSVLPGGPTNFWDGLIAGLSSLAVAGSGALILLGILTPWLVFGALVALAIVLIVRGAKRRRRARAPQDMASQTAPSAYHAPDTVAPSLPEEQAHDAAAASSSLSDPGRS